MVLADPSGLYQIGLVMWNMARESGRRLICNGGNPKFPDMEIVSPSIAYVIGLFFFFFFFFPFPDTCIDL